jgi:hypothetical protein
LADKPAAAPVLLRYQLKPGESLRYRLTADIHGSVPILDSPEPTELNAVVRIVYIATPKTRLADGTSDVEFKVETAELEIEKIPFPIPDDQAQQILNQTISMAQTGEVKKVQGGGALPFGVSIPGVDPKRLYALLFPIVFQESAVKPGDRWSFKSELLGGQGAIPTFSASLLPAGSSSGAGDKAPKAPVAKAGKGAQAIAGHADSSRLQEDFQMGVDQKLDKDKKPVKDGAAARYTRLGKIEGSGVFEFDRAKGRMDSGTVTIKANVNEDLVGEPDRADQPKRMVTRVEAKVRIQYEPAAATPASATKVGDGGRHEKERS